MSVRINLEIGHEAAIRTKRTHEGFTHDWEVFVRGCEHANIQYYVEKVVFHLHQTFQKPKRVIKDPPYSVKESGYAGFALPIEIYLRNKDEPKKVVFHYDLNLQPSGPPIYKVQKEKYEFNSPNEEFKAKLLKGGGIIVNPSNSQESIRDSRPVSEEKTQLVSKPRLSGSDYVKKHKTKLDEPRVPNSFQDLFGTPIKTSKTSHDIKSVSKDKNSNISKSSSGEKEKSKVKHSPHKDKEKSKDKPDSEKRSKDEKKKEDKKDHSKEREEKVKERKDKHEKSPKVRSPTPTKKPFSPKRPPSPIPKYKEEKKLDISKEKKNVDEKHKLEKKLKKEKRDKEKGRKEGKHKDKDKDNQKLDQKEAKLTSKEKEKHKETIKEMEPSPAPPKIDKKEKTGKDKESKEYIKESKEVEHVDKNGKLKSDKLEEKPKHKHKKKDKEKKEKDKVTDKEKSHKHEKKNDKNVINVEAKPLDVVKDSTNENEKVSLFNSPKNSSTENKAPEKPKKPLNTLLAEFPDSDSSNSSISSHDDLFNDSPTKVEPKKEPVIEPPSHKLEVIENTKSKREKSKKKDKKNEKDSEKKRKRKLDSSRNDEPLEKVPKEESSNSKDSDAEPNIAPMETQTEYDENSEDYMNILRDLQHKILTLQDNSELQKVVQLIAETGRFEVSAQTFDFDLCLLERSTIKQLQNFFETSQ